MLSKGSKIALRHITAQSSNFLSERLRNHASVRSVWTHSALFIWRFMACTSAFYRELNLDNARRPPGTRLGTFYHNLIQNTSPKLKFLGNMKAIGIQYGLADGRPAWNPPELTKRTFCAQPKYMTRRGGQWMQNILGAPTYSEVDLSVEKLIKFSSNDLDLAKGSTKTYISNLKKYLTCQKEFFGISDRISIDSYSRLMKLKNLREILGITDCP